MNLRDASPYLAGLAAGAIRFKRCEACGAAQTLDPLACQRCGSPHLAWVNAAATGTVYAVTRVDRAPSDVFRSLVPYDLVLVDLDEGARLMGHGTAGLAIGDHVVAAIFDHFGTPLIRFQPKEGRA